MQLGSEVSVPEGHGVLLWVADDLDEAHSLRSDLTRKGAVVHSVEPHQDGRHKVMFSLDRSRSAEILGYCVEPSEWLARREQNWTERCAMIGRQLINGKLANVSARQDPNGRSLSHLRYMAEQLAEGTMSETKACRWLGYLQAMMVVKGLTTLAVEKHRNLSSGEGD